jgi:hypothetical protein
MLDRVRRRRHRRRIAGGALVALVVVAGGLGAALLAGDDDPSESVVVGPSTEDPASIPPGRLITLLDGTDLVVQAPPGSGVDELPLSLAGALSWNDASRDGWCCARSAYAYQLTYAELTDAPPTTGRRTGGGQQVHVFDQAPPTAVSTPAPGAALYVVDFGSWVLLIPDLDDEPGGDLGGPGEVGLTDGEERRLLGGIDGVALDSGLRLELSGSVQLGPTDSPDATLGEVALAQTDTPEALLEQGRVTIIRRECPAELDDVLTVDSGTIHCFLDGTLEVVVSGPTQSPLQDLELVEATGATSILARLLGARESTPAQDGPGTLVQAEDDEQLAELWQDWGLEGDAPTVPDGSVVFGMLAQDGSCTHDIRHLVLVAEDVVQPEWSDDPDEGANGCQEYLATSAYVVAVEADDLPAAEVTVEVTETFGGGEDGRQVLGTGTITR